MRPLHFFVPHHGGRRGGCIPRGGPVLKCSAGVAKAQLEFHNGAGWPALPFENIGICRERNADTGENSDSYERSEPPLNGEGTPHIILRLSRNYTHAIKFSKQRLGSVLRIC